MATDDRPASLGCFGIIHVQDKLGQDVERTCGSRRWWRALERIEHDPVRKIPTSHRGPEEWTCEYAQHVVPRPSQTALDLDALPLTDPYGDNLRAVIASRLGRPETTPPE